MSVRGAGRSRGLFLSSSSSHCLLSPTGSASGSVSEAELESKCQCLARGLVIAAHLLFLALNLINAVARIHCGPLTITVGQIVVRPCTG